MNTETHQINSQGYLNINISVQNNTPDTDLFERFASCINKLPDTSMLGLNNLPDNITLHLEYGNSYSAVLPTNEINTFRMVFDEALINTNQEQEKHFIELMFQLMIYLRNPIYQGFINESQSNFSNSNVFTNKHLIKENLENLINMSQLFFLSKYGTYLQHTFFHESSDTITDSLLTKANFRRRLGRKPNPYTVSSVMGEYLFHELNRGNKIQSISKLYSVILDTPPSFLYPQLEKNHKGAPRNIANILRNL